MHVLYLHGFRSSPQSMKAQTMQTQLRQYCAQRDEALHWHCPQLPASPLEALELMRTIAAGAPAQPWVIFGSSLGGFYATVLAQERAAQGRIDDTIIVFNPLVHAARDLAQYIGEHPVFQNPDDHIFFRPEFVEILRDLQPETLTHLHRYWALIAKGDEVLNWREMAQCYEGCAMHIIEGSDHALSDFDQYVEIILAHLPVPQPPRVTHL